LANINQNRGFLPEDSDITLKLRLKPSQWEKTKQELINRGFLDLLPQGLAVHSFDHRQYESDSAKERMKRYRESMKQRNSYVTVTPPDTDNRLQIQITDTEKKKEVSLVSIAKTKNFRQPTIQELISYAQEINFQNFDPEKFINYYEARGWMIGKNKMKSWKAAVNIWKQNDKSEDNNNHKPIDLEKIEDGFNRITNPKIGQAYNFVISLLKFNELEINELKKRLTHDG
jgi:hypothetical protein